MDVSGPTQQHVEGVIEILLGGFQMPGVVVLLARLILLLHCGDQTIDRVSLGLKLLLKFGRCWLPFWRLCLCRCEGWSGRTHRRRRGSALLLSGVFAGDE